MIGSKILAINKNRLPCMIHIFIYPALVETPYLFSFRIRPGNLSKLIATAIIPNAIWRVHGRSVGFCSNFVSTAVQVDLTDTRQLIRNRALTDGPKDANLL